MKSVNNFLQVTLLSLTTVTGLSAASIQLEFNDIDNNTSSGNATMSGDLSGTASFTMATTDDPGDTTTNVHTITLTGDFSDNGQVDADQIVLVFHATRSSGNQSNTTVRWAPGVNISNTFSGQGGSITYADATYDPTSFYEIQFDGFTGIDADRGVSEYDGTNYDGGGTAAAGNPTIPLSGDNVVVTNVNVASPDDGGASTNGWISNLDFSFSVVPEPSSTSLLGLGALALVTRRRR